MPIDYKKYPPNWKSEIVPAIIKRAGDCCENCSVPNKSIVYGVKAWIKSEGGRYAYKAIWFSVPSDALRFKGLPCLKGYEGIVRQIRIVLTIAHLDHDETNWDVPLERLKALCQMCHLRYDAKEKYRRSQEKWKK